MSRRRARCSVLAGVMVLGSLLGGCGDDDADGGGAPATVTVFNGEANRLNAYAVTDTGFVKQTVIERASLDPDGLDINGQICFTTGPSGETRFIAGEDTGQSDENLQGWGFFELSGDRIGELSARQIGDLVPTYQESRANPENYGCGFLSDGRLLTTDVGDQASGPLNGQLIIWFPPLDRDVVPFCKIDTAIGTAQSIAVDEQDRVYVGSSRGDAQYSSGVYRFSGDFPTSDDASGGCGRADSTGAPLVDEGRVERELFINDPNVPTPAGVVIIPGGGFYVASVVNGVIAEFDADGNFVRIILERPEGSVGLPIPTGTPLGIGLAPDGTIYYADIGLRISETSIGPGRDLGTVRQIRFVDGIPQPPVLMDEGLNFPDGIGIIEIGG
jgi:hypothetical protein